MADTGGTGQTSQGGRWLAGAVPEARVACPLDDLPHPVLEDCMVWFTRRSKAIRPSPTVLRSRDWWCGICSGWRHLLASTLVAVLSACGGGSAGAQAQLGEAAGRLGAASSPNGKAVADAPLDTGRPAAGVAWFSRGAV